jgi:hypothetical protein
MKTVAPSSSSSARHDNCFISPLQQSDVLLATGINSFSREVVTKRLRLLNDLVPKAARIAVLVNPIKALARWRADPCGFIETALINPETGKTFILLDAEREFLKHALTIDADGRFQFSELLYAAIKKKR